MIYLASNSPMRAELLQQINIPFTQVVGDINETLEQGEQAQDYVLRLAKQKAQAGFNNSPQNKPVLGADTIIVLGEQIFEKPKNQRHAAQMLGLLSGKTHQVFTAIALIDAKQIKTKLVISEVTFRSLIGQDISDYWATGEPEGKAAGYAIQGIAAKFVAHIEGSYSAVVGLPLYETDQLISDFLGCTSGR